MSERVTWVACPACGGTAAVGWSADVPVEFDCAAGCLPTAADLAEHFAALVAEQHAQFHSPRHAQNLVRAPRQRAHQTTPNATRRARLASVEDGDDPPGEP